MNELEKRYKEKSDILNNFKKLFNEDKENFKQMLHNQSLGQQARILAFFLANDEEFYKQVNEYTGGAKYAGV